MVDVFYLLCVLLRPIGIPGFKENINSLGTVDGYSSSLRDDTGPVDGCSRIVHTCVFTCEHVHMHCA